MRGPRRPPRTGLNRRMSGIGKGHATAPAPSLPCWHPRAAAARVASGPDAADGPGEAGITVGELGEFGLIDAIAAVLPAAPGALVGIGDDPALLPAPHPTIFL